MSSVKISRRRVLAVGTLTFGFAAAACSSKSEDSAKAPAAEASSTAAAGSGQPFAPVIASSELTVGPSRFALGILERASNQPLADLQVQFRFFTVQGNQGTPRFEAPGRFASPARDVGAAGGDHAQHGSGGDPNDVGVYIAQVTFDQPGSWGVEATFKTADDRSGRVTAAFTVQPQSTTPAVGSPAPRTRNLTVRDVQDIREIDSAANPIPAFHQTTVADAIAAGRPVLVGFLTPGYCETRFCGPSYELMQKLAPKYADKAAFIHIEVYKDGVNRVLADAVADWNLTSEPYFFVIDRGGIVAAKFEGPVGLGELDEALQAVTT